MTHRCRAPVTARAVAAALGLFILGRPAAAAQALDHLGRPVTAVRLEIEGQETRDPRLVGLIETHLGQPLSMADVRESIAHLFGLGRFDDVRVDATASPGGVALTYQLLPLHIVRQVLFLGDRGLPESQLRSAVIDRFGASPPVGRAADAANMLEELYRDQGYLNARVSPRAEVDHSTERTTLIFEVQAGLQTRIGSIDVTGSAAERAQVLSGVDLAPGQPYEPPVIEARLTRYRDALRARGYYEARIDSDVSFGEAKTTADIVLTLQRGPLIHVVFQGDPLPAKQRAELVPVEREGSIDLDLLEDSKRAIEAYLRGQGYRDAAASYVPEGDDRERRIVFTVRRGPEFRLSGLEITGNIALPTSEIQSRIRLQRGEPFVQATLDVDLGQIGEEYRRRGFVGVSLKVALVDAAGAPLSLRPTTDQVRVVARIEIAEGVRTLVGQVTFSGNQAIEAAALQNGLGLQPGQPYYPPQVATDRDNVAVRYLNRGYQDVTVESLVTFSADHSRADIGFAVREGTQVFVDHILIIGNLRTSTDTIERELLLRPGQPLSFSDQVETQRRLSALGLFRRVRITELHHIGSETRRDLVVTVEEAPVTSIGYGGGLEGGRRLRRADDQNGRAVDVFELAPSGFFEYGRRNLWGKNRSITVSTRASFRRRNPLTDANAAATEADSGYGFNEYRALLLYQEPKLFHTSADAQFTTFVEQAIRSSFNFARRGTRAQVTRRFRPAYSLAGRYSLERTRLFDERIKPSDQPVIDRLFNRFRLSIFSTLFIRDSRDDALDPAHGGLVSVEGDLAARRIGSEVGLAKAFFQGFAFRRLPGARRIVLAGAARLGLAHGFPRTVQLTDASGEPVTDQNGNPVFATVKDVPASERFFAGGDTTVRGFTLDRLGTPETIDPDGFPKGGQAMVIFNGELRFPIWHDVGGVGFVDAGNVFAQVADLDLSEIRGSVGFGVRYKSPIGPIRVDLGFKLDRRVFGQSLEPRSAFHISLGQAF